MQKPGNINSATTDLHLETIQVGLTKRTQINWVHVSSCHQARSQWATVHSSKKQPWIQPCIWYLLSKLLLGQDGNVDWRCDIPQNYFSSEVSRKTFEDLHHLWLMTCSVIWACGYPQLTSRSFVNRIPSCSLKALRALSPPVVPAYPAIQPNISHQFSFSFPG